VLRRDFLLGRVSPGTRVLDLGCGLGEFTASLVAQGADAVGCDVAEEALRRARARHPGIEFVQSGEELPFEVGSFDAVWAGEVLEHVQDVLGLLAEVHRVLRVDGRLIISTPDHGPAKRLQLGLSRKAFETAFDPRSDHVRFFTKSTLRTALVLSQFGELDVTSQKGLLLATAQANQCAGRLPAS
jgi:2-polyprenyl-3-methyl-5-hydroxy-6-metoxy-1,4-benzoquinol methylase